MLSFLRGESEMDVFDMFESDDRGNPKVSDLDRSYREGDGGDLISNIRQILGDDSIPNDKKIYMIAKLLADREDVDEDELEDELLDGDADRERVDKSKLKKIYGEARIVAAKMRDKIAPLEDLRGIHRSGFPGR
jgi:hypothetical protein